MSTSGRQSRRFSVPPTASTESRDTRAQGKARSSQRCGKLSKRAVTKCMGSPRLPVPPANSTKPGFQPVRCRAFLRLPPAAAGNGRERHYYFIDESSLASTRQMREFLARLVPATACCSSATHGNIRVSKRAAPSSSCNKQECEREAGMRSFARKTPRSNPPWKC